MVVLSPPAPGLALRNFGTLLGFYDGTVPVESDTCDGVRFD